MRGRKPKPTALKIIAGNPGKRALPGNEPIPEGDAEMPDWLSDGARKVWGELAPGLEDMGVLTSGDSESFAMYCTEVAAYRADPAGTTVGAKALIARLGGEFGWSPATRARIAARPVTDPVEAEKRAFGFV